LGFAPPENEAGGRGYPALNGHNYPVLDLPFNSRKLYLFDIRLPR